MEIWVKLLFDKKLGHLCILSSYVLFFSEKMQLYPEEVYIKDEPFFPLPEHDKVGWI